MKMTELIKIDQNSRVPKYQQIIDSIIDNITAGNLKIDQKIPSINKFSEEFYLSRDTVEKAYSILSNRDIIIPIRGKGFYISRTKLINKLNILFLINKLSWYKMETYYSFVNTLGPSVYVSLHIYHSDEFLFLNLLEKHKRSYDYYVIMPHFKTQDSQHTNTTKAVNLALRKIPKSRLVVVGNKNIPFEDNYITVYEEYEKDIFNALKKGLKKIRKYQKIILLYPEKATYPYPKKIKVGFIRFCREHNLDFEIISNVPDHMVLLNGDLFITIEEDDLISLMNQIKNEKLTLGKDIGIISYNETPLKALLGITTISTDFKIMGETTAQMIISNKKGKVKMPFRFINRNSM